MSEEKQIEEMADVYYTATLKARDTLGSMNEGAEMWYAKAFYNAGYRHKSMVIDEFAERLKEAPIKCGLPLLGLSTKGEIEEYFNGIMLQVRDAIDNIAKEMKGA